MNLSQDIIEAIGLVAGILTTIAFLPQVFKTWQTKSAKDISLGMFISFSTGVFLWLVYGVLLNSFPLIISNMVTFVLCITILRFKLKYG